MNHKHQTLSPKISHELRDYIGGISGMANLIAENVASYIEKQEAKGIRLDSDIKEALEYANILAPYSDKALHYVDDILNSAQMESDHFVLGIAQDCDIKKLIKELLMLNEATFSKNDVIVKTEFAADVPNLKCDIYRLEQILINLITNAAKYSFKGGEVRIVVKYLDQNVSLEIIDHGIGMSQDEIVLALIGLGQKIDKSNLNKPIDSHGLGLPIVKQLVDIMGADMAIDSAKNLGTKITLKFAANASYTILT